MAKATKEQQEQCEIISDVRDIAIAEVRKAVLQGKIRYPKNLDLIDALEDEAHQKIVKVLKGKLWLGSRR